MINRGKNTVFLLLKTIKKIKFQFLFGDFKEEPLWPELFIPLRLGVTRSGPTFIHMIQSLTSRLED